MLREMHRRGCAHHRTRGGGGWRGGYRQAGRKALEYAVVQPIQSRELMPSARARCIGNARAASSRRSSGNCGSCDHRGTRVGRQGLLDLLLRSD